MASQHHLHAPLIAAAVSTTHTYPSPTIASATTATTPATPANSALAPVSDDDEGEDGQENHSGALSITSANVHDSAALPSMTDAHIAEEDGTGPLQTGMDYPHDPSALYEPSAPIPTYQLPALQLYFSHMNSSYIPNYETILEPPPTLQEAHLNLPDRTSFAPITSFFHSIAPERPTVPGLDLVQVPESITRDDLRGDRCDTQGINWTVRNTTRSHIRAKRFDYESAKLSPSSQRIRKPIPRTPHKDNFYRFRRNNSAHRAFFPHFQLRNVLAVTSRTDIYYAAGHQVFRTDAHGNTPDVVIDLSKRLTLDGSITTIASTDNVLVAGAFDGEYAITDLTSTYGSPCTFGRTTDYNMDTKSRIVNHMHLFDSRNTYYPQVVLCSNDHRLRVLDCVTDTLMHSFTYSAAVNCAATSPDGRMRVVVGDFQETLITNAETGRPFETLRSHTEDTFACAWADDGIHVATAAQDSTIVVWDARYWDSPLTVLTSELSVPRSLRFSPVGSGSRVLIAAEADDYVNVINAQTFETKQVLDFFGPIGGVAFSPEGQSLFVANGERRFGGIIEYERTGWAETTAQRDMSRQQKSWNDVMTDWVHDDQLSSFSRVACGDMERERRGVDLGGFVV